MRIRPVLVAWSVVFVVGACSATPDTPGGGTGDGGGADTGRPPRPGTDAGPGGTDSGAVPGADSGGVTPGAEECGNGYDDDADGQVDEGCPCVPGTFQPCYPRDPAQVGRGICRMGSQGCEGSGEFGTWTECVGAVVPATETCLDMIDNDCNGTVDDGPTCTCTPMSTQPCYAGPAGTEGVGICSGGTQDCVFEAGVLSWGDCLDQVLPRTEVCGNGQDDDCNGAVDDAPGCECTSGMTRTCYSGPMSEIGVGVCRAGTQNCLAGGHWSPCMGEVGPSAETCGDGLDNDCNGTTDDGCPTVVEVPVHLSGDCLTARCPIDAPYPVGCSIVMSGDDPRGCVASTPTSPVVYFQEGDQCGAGHVDGTLMCSSEPGAGLNMGSCMINKSTRYYPTSRSGCPAT